MKRNILNATVIALGLVGLISTNALAGGFKLGSGIVLGGGQNNLVRRIALVNNNGAANNNLAACNTAQNPNAGKVVKAVLLSNLLGNGAGNAAGAHPAGGAAGAHPAGGAGGAHTAGAAHVAAGHSGMSVHVVNHVEKLMQIPAGATLTLQAANLGDVTGQVVLQLDKLAMPATINEWKADGVTATLPTMSVTAPVHAEIILLKADGAVASTVKVELIRALQTVQAAPSAVIASVVAH